LRKEFPLLTTKRVPFKSVAVELLWILRGDTNTKYLTDNGVTIWDEWATEEQCAKFGRKAGDLGPVYGKLWRSWEALDPKKPLWSEDVTDQFGGDEEGFQVQHIDQITKVVEQIKTNPTSRRLIVTGWNPATCESVALPPCHTLFQFYVDDGELSCQLYQRSADVFLGVPFNIASYALLTHMIAQVTGLRVGEFVHTFGDVHLYTNHVDQAKLQLTRQPFSGPKLVLNSSVKAIDDFRLEHLKIEEYKYHPTIKADVAV